MLVLDVNTTFGRSAHDNQIDLSLPALLGGLKKHGVTAALSLSLRGVHYDADEGNEETLVAANENRQILPVAFLDPRRYLGWEKTIDHCLEAGFVAFRFFPDIATPPQSWEIDCLPFRNILDRLSGKGMPVFLSAGTWGTASKIARITAGYDLPVVLTDAHYGQMAEVISVMQRYPHLYADTNRLATPDSVAIVAREVGANRVLFGSGAPQRPIQGAINAVLHADLADHEKQAIMGENAVRLFRLDREKLTALQAAGTAHTETYSGPIIDMHTHMGRWRFPVPGDGAASLLRLMERHKIERCVISSALGIVYDMAEGNRRLYEAIRQQPTLHGYIVVNPNYLEQSREELDRWYQHDCFVGAKIHCEYSSQPTSSPAIRAVIAEVAKYRKPLLIHNAGADWLSAIKEIARTHPELPIIIAHGGGWGTGPAIRDVPNLFLEFCSSGGVSGRIDEALAAVGPERLMFGSDMDLLDPAYVLGTYQDANFSPAARELVMHRTARRMFGWE
jgi:predicted TIM-barrel fold metal-dependent hydrolase